VAELTVSMHVVRPHFLETAHITHATELINKTPGIEVRDGQASIRGGSGFSYGAGSRVLALVDGLPVLSADAGSIRWQFLPLENISQIEIIKGASSVLYGSSALNGVINFRTAFAGADPVTRFNIETGVFGRPANRDWVWWDTPRTYSSTSFSHNRQEGNTDIGIGLRLLSDNGYRRLNDEKLGRLNLKLRHRHGTVGGLSYGLNVNTGLTRKTDFVLWENAVDGALKQDESTASELDVKFLTFDPFISLRSEERYSHDLRTRFQLTDNRFPERGHNNSNALSFLAEYQSWYRFSDFLDMNFGILENFSRVESPLYGDHNALNLAAYSQADISPADRIKIVAGVRMEHNSLDGVSDEIVPLFRAGLNYRLSDYTFLRASWGQGYRYPSIAERHAATTLGSVRIFANPEIRAESGWTSEIGIKQGIITGNFSGQLDMALFYSRYFDMIEFVLGNYYDQSEGVFDIGFKASNVEQSVIYGGEVEVSLSGFTGRFRNTITGGYVFTWPVEINRFTSIGDEFLKYRRKHSLKLNLNTSYRKFDSGFSLTANSRILNIDAVFLHEMTREQFLPGFYDYWGRANKGHILIDPYIGYNIGDNKYRISLVVKNVLNTEYLGRPGDIMPHRNFSLRLAGTL
jgi:outer membrane receptor protein involved in Fe transport